MSGWSGKGVRTVGTDARKEDEEFRKKIRDAVTDQIRIINQYGRKTDERLCAASIISALAEVLKTLR